MTFSGHDDSTIKYRPWIIIFFFLPSVGIFPREFKILLLLSDDVLSRFHSCSTVVSILNKLISRLPIFMSLLLHIPIV